MGRTRDRSRSRSRSGSLSSTGSGRTAKARDWNGEGGYRLHLSDLAMGVSRREIEKLFRPYGPLNEVWVASNPPCFAFINFRHRTDSERALREIDGKVVNGNRVGLSWARARNYGGRPHNSLLYRSPSPSRRRDYRDSYTSRRSDDQYSRRRYSRSRSRSPHYQQSAERAHQRRRSPSSGSRSRSPSPKEKRRKSSRREDKQHRSRHPRSQSKTNSDRVFPSRTNGKETSRSPSHERPPAVSFNGDDHRTDIEVNEQIQ